MEYLSFDLDRKSFTVDDPTGFWTKKKKKIASFIFLVFLLTFVASFFVFQQLRVHPTPITSTQPSYNTPPKLSLPDPITLPFPRSVCTNSTYQLTHSMQNARFKDCQVEVTGSNLQFETMEFVNSPVTIEDSNNVVFQDIVFTSAPEETEKKENNNVFAVEVKRSNKVVFDHVRVADTTNGMQVDNVAGIEVKNSFFENNMGTIGSLKIEGSTEISIHDNLFRMNYPAAIMMSGSEGNPNPTFEIYRNKLTDSVIYGILIEDWNSSLVSRAFNNVITGGRGTGITIQLDSTLANVQLLHNYVGKKSTCEKLTPSIDARFGNGWCFAKSDGIKIENAGNILLKGNMFVQNERNGLDLRETENVSVFQNVFFKNKKHALYAASSEYQMENNTFAENGQNIFDQKEPNPEVLRSY